MKAWLPPKQYERRYQRFHRRTIAEAKAEFLRRLGHIVKLQTVNKYSPEPEEMEWSEIGPTQKEHSDEIAFLIAGLFTWWQAQKPAVRNTIRGYYSAVNAHNDKQFLSVVKDVSGVVLPPSTSVPFNPKALSSPLSVLLDKFGDDSDVYRQEPYLEGVESNWVSTQETYIDKSVTQAIADSELIVRNAIVTSAVANVVSNALDNLFGKTSNRAGAFAEQQVNSLNTQLSENRQRSLGANEYVWVTQRDERVRGTPGGLYPGARPSHYARDNQIFSWKNPPEGGHPGEAPNCRCVARFILPR